MKQEAWRRGEYEIVLGEGLESVDGYVSETFGLRKRDDGWQITHLRTGYRICTPLFIPTLGAAKELCARLMPVVNWRRVTPKSAKRYQARFKAKRDRIAKRMRLKFKPWYEAQA